MGEGFPPQFVIRNAVAEDAPALARVAVMAGHGLMSIFYEGLIPGKTPEQVIAERRILRPGSFAALERWRVIEDEERRTLGALNSFPHELFETAEPDPLLPAERTSIIDSLSELEATARGSYVINLIGVFPGRRKSGAGGMLMAEAERLARVAGFSRLSLVTFEANAPLVAFYRRLGFEISGTRPIRPHPALEYGGNWALLCRNLT